MTYTLLSIELCMCGYMRKRKNTQNIVRYFFAIICFQCLFAWFRIQSASFVCMSTTINWILFENINHLSYSTFGSAIVSFHHCISYTTPFSLLLIFSFFFFCNRSQFRTVFSISFYHSFIFSMAFLSFIHSHCTDTVTTQRSTIFGKVLSLRDTFIYSDVGKL